MLHLLVLCVPLAVHLALAAPFLQINNGSWVIGNDLWNITIGHTYGTKLYYKNHDLVGDAVGHYVSYNGAVSNLNWTAADIVDQGADYVDVSFTANEGEMHWVIYQDLAGAYQYFVNHALPVLGEFRTLFRLDNTTFVNGRTNIKDGPLPPFELYFPPSVKVQDETWQLPNETYITKYDWSDFIKTVDYYGVYGDAFGSWYIHPPQKDYINGNQLKQELTVHRESATGDVVQLNMIHGTHFQASSSDAFPDNKTWGPWLWYLNDGSQADAAARTQQEWAAWPYAWFKDPAYQSRGSVSGVLTLSDGRAAAGAAVFLGDDNPNKTALDMGGYNYYTTYADENGAFKFTNVMTQYVPYGLQAWSNGGAIADISTSFLHNDVAVTNGQATDLGPLTWTVPNTTQIFRVGDIDRTARGFEYGEAPYQHALVANCPANTTYTVGQSEVSDWCFAQSALGTWTINFDVDALPLRNATALLTVSLAGYSSGVSSNVLVNGQIIGELSNIVSDPGLYRSATAAGEWHLLEFEFAGSSVLKLGANTVSFVVTKTSLWHGIMWDAIKLAWR